MEPQRRTWPIQSGTVPVLAEGYTWRPETGNGPWEELRPGSTVVVGPDTDARASAGRRGGTGKTQLAAAFARRLWAAGNLDLLVWIEAGSRDRLVAGYAGALSDIRIAAPPGRPEAAAARFLSWLGTTSRRWLVVLDGIADPADIQGLWPYGRAGQTLATTLLGGLSPKLPRLGRAERNAAQPQQLSIGLSPFSQREALQYLTDRLNDDPYQAAGALDVAAILDCLPAGLNLAVTYLLDTGLDCRQYRLTSERYRRDWTDWIGSNPLASSWMLAVDRAGQLAPGGLPWRALKLVAVLGPAGIPGAVLTSAAASSYIIGRQVASPSEQASVRAVFGDLERVGLVRIEPADEVRTVHVAGVIQASVRQAMGPTELRRAVQVAADAICERWPGGGARADGAEAELVQALRDCATSLRRSDDLALWEPARHPLLAQAGESLDEAHMVETALSYWRDLAGRSAKQHGVNSPLTWDLRERLASAASAADRDDEAIGLREELCADIDEIEGPASPEAIAARASLAVAYRTAGRLDDAIRLGTRVAAESDQLLGAAHPERRRSLRELGRAYCDAGLYREAIDVLQRCLALHAQTIGTMQPETVAVRGLLADAYRRAGRPNDSIAVYTEALAQVENAAGATRRDSITAREDLAMASYLAGRPGEAATTFERALADWRRIPGSSPASTINPRSSLAAIYCLNGRPREAIPLLQSLQSDLEQIRGSAHPDTFRARWNLAAALHLARRLAEAVELGEGTLAECEVALGMGHRETLTTLANLAHAYHATGRLKRASAYFDRALRDCERAVGPDDSLTIAVRDLRQRYLAGRQGLAPIIAPPGAFSSSVETEGR
jgi:tetratricopeptide (TPR) repeat protein